MNINFVQKKRDDVPFSPKDLQSVESFLQVIFQLYFPSWIKVPVNGVIRLVSMLIWQVEKRSGNTPFTQYYKSIMSKAASRKMITSRKVRFTWSLTYSSYFCFVWVPSRSLELSLHSWDISRQRIPHPFSWVIRLLQWNE